MQMTVCVRRAIVQYVEKIDPGLRALLLGKTTLMTQFRVLTANNSGVAAVLTAARGVRTAGVSDEVLESAGMCDALSMDMAKEMLGKKLEGMWDQAKAFTIPEEEL